MRPEGSAGSWANIPVPSEGIKVQFVYDDEVRIDTVTVLPRIGEQVYVQQDWDEPMTVTDIHHDAHVGRIYIFLE